MQAPDLFLVGAVPELCEGNLKLRRPRGVFDSGLHIPDRIPVEIGIVRICENQISLLSCRGDIKFKPRPVIVITVEIHSHNVACERVAIPQLAADLPGFIVEGPDGNIDVVVVVEDLDLRRLRGFCAFPGDPLGEIACPLSRLPARVVKHAVDVWLLSDEANGVVDSHLPVRRRAHRIDLPLKGRSVNVKGEHAEQAKRSNDRFQLHRRGSYRRAYVMPGEATKNRPHGIGGGCAWRPLILRRSTSVRAGSCTHPRERHSSRMCDPSMRR